MAVLNSTSPGQLPKYVIPTISKLETAMKKGTPVSRGSGKSVRLKNSPANVEALKLFSTIGSNPKNQKAALAIQLEVVDTKTKTIAIGSIDKPNIKYNLGDMSEGVVGAAIAARFIYKNRNITAQQVYAVIRSLPPASNYPGKKGKRTERTFSSANEKKGIIDNVRFYLSLAEVNMAALQDPSNAAIIRPYVQSAVRYANSTNVKKWSKLLYENGRQDYIEVLSDGLGGQTTTKVDVSVKVNNEPVDIKVSLKAGDVKQFGQVSGIEFEKQEKLWETSFGYGSEISGLEKNYDALVAQNQAAQAVTLVYNKVATMFNRDMRTTKRTEILRKFAESIKFFATLNEDNVTLLQVGNDAAKLYSFDQIAEALGDTQLVANIQMGKTGLPTLLINTAENVPLIQYRVKQEFKPDGSPYIRNYVEKQKGLTPLIGQNL